MNKQLPSIQVSESILKLAKLHEVPEYIALSTRYGGIETVLVLTGCICGEEEQIFNYKIVANYPYQLTGETDDYISIDFSSGPTLFLGDEIYKNLVLDEIDPPLLALKKLSKQD